MLFLLYVVNQPGCFLSAGVLGKCLPLYYPVCVCVWRSSTALTLGCTSKEKCLCVLCSMLSAICKNYAATGCKGLRLCTTGTSAGVCLISTALVCLPERVLQSWSTCCQWTGRVEFRHHTHAPISPSQQSLQCMYVHALVCLGVALVAECQAVVIILFPMARCPASLVFEE